MFTKHYKKSVDKNKNEEITGPISNTNRQITRTELKNWSKKFFLRIIFIFNRLRSDYTSREYKYFFKIAKTRELFVRKRSWTDRYYNDFYFYFFPPPPEYLIRSVHSYAVSGGEFPLVCTSNRSSVGTRIGFLV